MSDKCKKRKKKGFYGNQVKRSKYALNLKSGLKGFLCTHNGHPKFCIREAYNTLDKFTQSSDKQDMAAAEKNGDDDFEAELQRDVEKVNAESEHKEFQVVETGVLGCVFIASATKDPLEIMEKIMTDIMKTGRCQSRKILRMLPIQVTCKAYVEDIMKASVSLMDEFFCGEPTTYAIVINRRSNNSVVREELIQSLGLMIRDRNPFHTADLKKSRLTVLVEILKNICCLSIVKDYNDRRKYNLVELGLSCQRKSAESNVHEKGDASGEASEVSDRNGKQGEKQHVGNTCSDNSIIAGTDPLTEDNAVSCESNKSQHEA